MSSRFDRAIIIQIVVTTVGKPQELFRLMGEREQPLAQTYRNCEVPLAVHDQKRSGDARNALVRAKLVPYQPTNRHDSKNQAGNIRYRRIGGFQYHLSDRLLGRQRDRDTAAQRKTPNDNSIRAVSR